MNNTHPTSSAGSYFEVSQIRGVAQRMKVHHSEPSMDRSIKIVPQLEQGLEPYSIMFKGLRAKKEAGSITMFIQRNDKYVKTLFWG
jgi:hypothetical protein